MSFSDAQKAMLAEKLSQSAIRPAKSFGPKGDYIEGWYAIAEANRIFGFDGWSYDVIETRLVAERDREVGQAKKPGFGVTYVARLRVIAGGVQREDVGAGHGYDADLGLAHESAIKEAVTDALKRALRTFGNPFGLALYDKERGGVADEWSVEFNELSALVAGCKTINDLADFMSSDRAKKFWKEAPGEWRSEVLAVKDRRKAELSQQEAA